MRIPSGTTDQPIYFVAVDATDLITRKTGLSSFTVYRARNGGTATAFTTPTVAEVSSSNMPGVYSLLLDEDMTIDSGDDSQEMAFHITATGMAPVTRTIELYRVKYTLGSTHPTITGDAYARLGAPAGASVSADIAAAKVDTAAIKTKTDSLTFTVAGMVDSNVVDWKGATAPAMSGDAYARLGAPAGASVSADVAAVKVDTAAVKVKTDFLPSATAGAAGGVFIAGSNAATSITTALTANVIGNVTGNLSGSVGSVTADVGITQAAADKAWSTTTRLLTAGTNIVLAKGTGVTGFNDLSAAAVNAEADTALSDVGLTTTITGRIDAAISSRLATGGYTTPPTVGAIADQVWDEALSGHVAGGSAGAALGAAGSGSSAADIADAVWDELVADHAGVGSTGAAIAAAGGSGDPWATALPGAYGAGTAGKIVGDNLDAAISTRATATALATVAGYVDTEVAAIKAKTDLIPTSPAAVSDIPTAIQNADALLNRDMSTGTDSGSPTVRTPRQALRFLRNKWSLSGSALTVMKEDDSTTSWTAVVSTSPGADPISATDPAGP